MGNVVSLHRSARGSGCVHVWREGSVGFCVAHESASGDSWGGFLNFNTALDAVAGARRLALHEYGDCEVFVPDDVQAILPVGTA